MTTDTTPTAETTPVTKASPFATRAQYEALIAELGLTWKEQSGFLRVDGPEGRRLYVANTKTVRRVDVAGFEHRLGTLTKVPHVGPFGNVKQQMIVGVSPATDLDTFRLLAEHMKALEPVVKEKKAPKAKAPVQASSPDSSDVPVTASSPEAEALAAEKAARIERIKAYAAKTGLPISKLSVASADGA